MRIDYDPNKSQRNQTERDLPFDQAAFFEWQTAVIVPDTRFDYPELRLTATGFLNEHLHVLCFTPIANGIRVISFRKANKREIKKYEIQRTLNR